jgi:hypothetical protein
MNYQIGTGNEVGTSQGEATGKNTGKRILF